jgi:hypothetical protein
MRGRSLVAGALLAMAVSIGWTASAVASDRMVALFGTGASNYTLYHFDVYHSGQGTSTHLTGILPSDTLVGFDYDPSLNLLFAVDSYHRHRYWINTDGNVVKVENLGLTIEPAQPAAGFDVGPFPYVFPEGPKQGSMTAFGAFLLTAPYAGVAHSSVLTYIGSSVVPDIAALSYAKSSPWGPVLLGVDATRRSLVRFEGLGLRTIAPITRGRGFPLYLGNEVSLETVNSGGRYPTSTTYLACCDPFYYPLFYRLDVATGHVAFLGAIENPTANAAGLMVGITTEPVVQP